MPVYLVYAIVQRGLSHFHLPSRRENIKMQLITNLTVNVLYYGVQRNPLAGNTYLVSFSAWCVPTGSPSHGGDVTVYVPDVNQPSLPTPFVCFCLYGPFNCILFHKFSRQLSAFSLCVSGLVLPYWSFEPYIFF